MTNRQLKTAVQRLRDAERRIRPDGAWVARTRNHLLQTARRDAAARPVLTHGARFKALVLAFVPRTTVDLIRGPVMAVLSVFGVIVGGSLASVSAAERSIPGDLLYPVKLATEQARILMEPEAPDQLKLKAEFVQRRGDEIRQLAKNDTPKRTERLKEATDMLKKDLDAVKQQLHSVANESPSPRVVEAAKDVDERSGKLAQTLKEVKDVVPEEVRSNVTEVQVAAVNAGVKAVQVLIDKRNDPETQGLVSDADLKRAVTEHVQGLEEGIADTAKKVAQATAASEAEASSTAALLPLAASTTAAVPSDLLKGSIDQLKAAQASLEETKQLLDKDQFGAIKDKLGEATKAVASAEKSLTFVLPSLPAATSTAPVPAEPDPSAATPTSSVPVAATSTSEAVSGTLPTVTSSTK